MILAVLLLIYLLHILYWQRRKSRERFGEAKDRVYEITKTITSAFTTNITNMLKLKKQLVLKTSGNIHVIVK